MTTRRAVLIAGGAVAAGGALAACGSSNGAASTKQPTSQSAKGVLGPSSDVPVGGGMVYADAEVVVTQPVAGEFLCFTAVCPHQGCLVGGVESDGGADHPVIVCPCHGSLFNGLTGAVEKGPAVQGLAPLAVKDSNGTLTLG